MATETTKRTNGQATNNQTSHTHQTTAKPTRYKEIVAIALAATGLLFAVCLFSYNPNDDSLNVAAGRGTATGNLIGSVGAFVADGLLQSLGVVAFLVPILFFLLAARVFLRRPLRAPLTRIVGLLAVVIAFAALVSLTTLSPIYDGSFLPGGLIGASVATSLASILNKTGTAIVLLAAAFVGLLLGTNFSFTRAYEFLQTSDRFAPLRRIPQRFNEWRAQRKAAVEAKRETTHEAEQSKDATLQAADAPLIATKRDAPEVADKDSLLVARGAQSAKLTTNPLASSGREKTAAERVADFMRETEPGDSSVGKNSQSSRVVTKLASTTDENSLRSAASGQATLARAASANEETTPTLAGINHENLAFSSGASLITKDAVSKKTPVETNGLNDQQHDSKTTDDSTHTPLIVRTLNAAGQESGLTSKQLSEDVETDDLRVNTQTDTPTRPAPRVAAATYNLPDVKFLNAASPRREQAEQELRALGELLTEKCREFNVTGKLEHICPGPVVTTYEFKPDPGVKYARVTGLVDDLCLALKAESIRIDRVPGKAHVGIEVPNPNRETISMREVVESRTFRESESKLTLALGKTIDGLNYVADLAKMPHLLIAGATGAGKSVCLNSLVVSILYKASPDEVKFIMVDPKRLELGLYADIPHLATPIITEPKRAAIALKWAVKEMEDRYKNLAKWGVRNIAGYNAEVLRRNAVEEFDENGNEWKPLPYIVIIIDELADLMMVSGREVEESITRLAQMARAVGIHLVLATQRPSVDVITGLIKANFPSRISFRVSSKVDSRTIIDMNGSEQLLGRGDMLFLPPGTSRLVRVHGAYIDEVETNKIVSFIKAQSKPEYDTTITQSEEEQAGADGVAGERDEMFDQALRICVEMKRASTSVLQRRLRIGYGRAAAILDQMEREGLIGQADGARPRPVLGAAYETIAHWDEIEEVQ